MKLLLINTPINLQDTLGNFSPIYDDIKMIPSGIAYLASFVRNAGIEVQILDQFAESLSMGKVIKYIEGFSPDLIGYSATTPNFSAAVGFAEEVKIKFPGIPSVMGGYHPSVCPEQTLKYKAIDFVIRDEGEMPLLELCKRLETGNEDYGGIAGLSYKTAGGIVHNKKVPPVDVDALPFPSYDLLPMSLYSSPSYSKFASPCYQMIASRGCPFACSYCINAELNVAAKYRRRKAELVVSEMELLVSRFGARQIQFWDPVFPLGHDHAMLFCEEVMRRGLHKKIIWSSTTRAETLTEETVRTMAEAGCKGLGFGIESGVQELLESVNKKVDFDKVRRICRAARKRGIVVTGAFIIGFPGETPEMTAQTVAFAKSLDIHYAQFSIMIPYPGTPLYHDLKDKGEIPDIDDGEFIRYNQNIGMTDVEPIYIPKGRSAQELKSSQRRAYRDFYLRPRTVRMHLPHIKLTTLGQKIKSFLAIVRLCYDRRKK